MRILLVEDDESLAVLLGDRFRLAGHQVTRAADGESAWKAIADGGRFDLALLDVMLPRLNGWELCRRIKSAPDIQSLPVIVLTAKTQPADELMSFESGADEFLVKPFDFSDVLKAAERLGARAR